MVLKGCCQTTLYLSIHLGFDAETPIHEFGHIWAKATKQLRPELYAKGVSLIKKSAEWQELQIKRKNPDSVYFNYTDSQLAEEAMATAIGRHGEQIFEHKEDQSQWNKLRQQILDWVGERLGITAINDLTLDKFVKLAATEIVTGDALIGDPWTEQTKDSIVKLSEFKEVAVGTTRDYSRGTPPVKEFDTHNQWKAHKLVAELQPALDNIQPGQWIGWTTGTYGDAVPQHKRNAKLNARIEAKVNGMRKHLESQGFQLKQDPVNPGYHIISPKLEFSESVRDSKRNVPDHIRVQMQDVNDRGVELKKKLKRYKSLPNPNQKRIDRIESELNLAELEFLSLYREYREHGGPSLKDLKIDKYKSDKEFVNRKTGTSGVRGIGAKVKSGTSGVRRFDYLEATPEGKNANDVMRKIRKNLARGQKRQGTYKKALLTEPTRKVIEATELSLEKVGDQLSYDQLVEVNNKLKELINADIQKQRADKNEVRNQVDSLISDTSNIDASKKVSAEDIEANNTLFAKARRIKLSNILSPASNNDFYGLLYSLLPRGKKRSDAEGFIRDQLLDPLENANIEYLRMKNDLRTSWNNGLKFLGKTKLAQQQALTKKTGIVITPGQLPKNLNVGQVVKLYNYILDGDAKLQGQLQNTGVDENIQQQILQYVDANPNIKKFAENIPATYNKVALEVNETIQRHGYEGFNITGKYTPLTVDSKSQDSYNQELEKAVIGQPGINIYSVMSGRLKKRRGGGQIDLTSSLQQDFDSYLNGPPRTAAFLDFAQNASAFFGAKQLKAMEAAYGKNHADAIRDSLFRMVSGRNQPPRHQRASRK